MKYLNFLLPLGVVRFKHIGPPAPEVIRARIEPWVEQLHG
jgi:hypothetical protein